MYRIAVLLAAIVVASQALAAEAIIDSFEELRFRVPAEKASASLVPGHNGQAIELKFDKGSQNVFFLRKIRGQLNGTILPGSPSG